MRAGVSPGLEGGHEASPTTLTVTLQKELCMGVPSEPIGGQAWGSNRQDTPLPAASPRPSLYTSEDLWDLNRHVGRPGRKPRPRGNENHTPHGHVVCVRDGGRGRLAVVDRQTARAGHRLRSPLSRAGKLEGRDGSPFGQQLPTPMSASLTRLGRRGLRKRPFAQRPCSRGGCDPLHSAAVGLCSLLCILAGPPSQL